MPFSDPSNDNQKTYLVVVVVEYVDYPADRVPREEVLLDGSICHTQSFDRENIVHIERDEGTFDDTRTAALTERLQNADLLVVNAIMLPPDLILDRKMSHLSARNHSHITFSKPLLLNSTPVFISDRSMLFFARQLT